MIATELNAGVAQFLVRRPADSELNVNHRNKTNAGVAQLVEHQPSKLNVAGSSLVSRSTENTGCLLK